MFMYNRVLIVENFFPARLGGRPPGPPGRHGPALNWDAGLDGAGRGQRGWLGLVGEQGRSYIRINIGQFLRTVDVRHYGK